MLIRIEVEFTIRKTKVREMVRTIDESEKKTKLGQCRLVCRETNPLSLSFVLSLSAKEGPKMDLCPHHARLLDVRRHSEGWSC